MNTEYLSISDITVMKYKPRIRELKINHRNQDSLLFIINGKYTYNFSDNYFTAQDGNLVYLPYGSNYEYSIESKSAECMQIEFKLKYHDSELPLSDHPICISNLNNYVFELFNRIINCKPNDFECLSIVYKLLSFLNYDEGNLCKNKKIRPAVEYIHSHPNEQIYINELSRLCFLSESQFRRLFLEQYNCSPVVYKNNLRINLAKAMLSGSYNSICEIADALNFDNVYSFSRFFKSYTGLSPKKYSSKYSKTQLNSKILS